MNPLLRFLGVVLTSTLMLAPVACEEKSTDKSEDDSGDKDDDDDDAKKKKKKKKGDKEDSKGLSGGGDSGGNTKAAVSGPSAGAVLDYMPADCPKGRAYVNTAALFSDANAQSVLREITTKILSKQRDAETDKAVAVLKESGFDLATGIREVAMCMGMSEDPAIGLSLSVGDPLGLLQKVAKSLGEAELPVTTKGTAKILTSDDVTFVQPAEGILIFGPKAFAEAAIDKKGGAGFATARGQVGYMSFQVENDGTMEGKITRASANFNLWGSLKMAALAKEDPKKIEQEMRKKVLEESGKGLKNSPFSLVDERLQNATFQMKDGALIATLSIPTSDVTSLLKAAAPQIGVQLGSGGGDTPAPAASGADPLDELLKMMKKK